MNEHEAHSENHSHGAACAHRHPACHGHSHAPGARAEHSHCAGAHSHNDADSHSRDDASDSRDHSHRDHVSHRDHGDNHDHPHPHFHNHDDNHDDDHSHHDSHGHSHGDEDWRLLAALAAGCALFAGAGWAVELFANASAAATGAASETVAAAAAGAIPAWAAPALFGAAMLCGGWDALHDSLHNLPRGKLDIHFLMLMVAVGAASIGAWGEGALLLLLFSASGALEAFVMHRTRRAIDSLFKEQPETASLVAEDGTERAAPVADLRAGDVLHIRPGDVFPVDGAVLSGESAADESALSGESVPAAKAAGSAVFAGTLNLWGAVRVRVSRPARESSLQRIIRLIRDAQRQKPPSQRFTDRFGTRYTALILGTTAAMFFVWWLGFGFPAFEAADGGAKPAFYRAMTLLVVASPCALVLSIPSAILAAIAWGARHGILFRGGAAIEKLAEVDCVAFDKTGTLTTGNLAVERVESFPPGREADVLRAAAALEAQASHPIARAICARANAEADAVANAGTETNASGSAAAAALPPTPPVVTHFQNRAGFGVVGTVDGAPCVLGRRDFVEKNAAAVARASRPCSQRTDCAQADHPNAADAAPFPNIPDTDGTEVWVAIGAPATAAASDGLNGLNGQNGQASAIPSTQSIESIPSIEPLPLPTGEPPVPLPAAADAAAPAAPLLGRIVLRDTPRPRMRETVAAIKAFGLRPVMLTGDRADAANGIATLLGIAEVHSALTPEDKVSRLRDLRARALRPAMIGDGVNDAPALAAAHVSVGMGARGSDAALEQCDVVLMHDRIERFVAALRLSHRARRVIRQNLAISLGTIAVMVVASLGVALPLTLGVFAHEGSTVLVCLNSLRLLFSPAPKE